MTNGLDLEGGEGGGRQIDTFLHAQSTVKEEEERALGVDSTL